MSDLILHGSLTYYFAEKPRLAAAYLEIARIFHRAGLDVWHRPDTAPHPTRFTFGRKALTATGPDDAPHAAAWINPAQSRLVISGGLPDDAGLFHFRRQFPAKDFPRQQDSQNIKIDIDAEIPPDYLDALNQRLAAALAAMPADSFFAPRPDGACYWPQDYAHAALAAA